MGIKDLAIRKLAQHCLADIAPLLLPDRHVEVERIEEVQLKLVERLSDNVAFCRIDGHPALLHVEFEASLSRAARLPARMMAYNALLRQAHPARAVHSAAVYLLADTGSRRVPTALRQRPGDQPVEFPYRVFLPQEHPITVEQVAATPGIAPLALLSPGIQARDLSAVKKILAASELPDLPAPDLLALTYILGGHRFDGDLLDSYLRSEAMESSPTYQAILREGRAEGRAEGQRQGLQVAIRTLVGARLGAWTGDQPARLDGLDAVALEALLERLASCADAEALRAILDDALGPEL